MQWEHFPTLINQQEFRWWFNNMRITFAFSMTALFILTMSTACSQVPVPSVEKKPTMLNQIVQSSYIVKAQGDGEQVIRHVFAEYGVVLVLSLGNGQFELRLNRDPGLDALKSKASRSDGAVTAVQPNFVYHTF